MREVTWFDLVLIASVMVIFFVPVFANFSFPNSAVVDHGFKNVGLFAYFVAAYGGLFLIERSLRRNGVPRRGSFWARPVSRKK